MCATPTWSAAQPPRPRQRIDDRRDLGCGVPIATRDEGAFSDSLRFRPRPLIRVRRERRTAGENTAGGQQCRTSKQAARHLASKNLDRGAWTHAGYAPQQRRRGSERHACPAQIDVPRPAHFVPQCVFFLARPDGIASGTVRTLTFVNGRAPVWVGERPCRPGRQAAIADRRSRRENQRQNAWGD